MAQHICNGRWEVERGKTLDAHGPAIHLYRAANKKKFVIKEGARWGLDLHTCTVAHEHPHKHTWIQDKKTNVLPHSVSFFLSISSVMLIHFPYKWLLTLDLPDCYQSYLPVKFPVCKILHISAPNFKANLLGVLPASLQKNLDFSV